MEEARKQKQDDIKKKTSQAQLSFANEDNEDDDDDDDDDDDEGNDDDGNDDDDEDVANENETVEKAANDNVERTVDATEIKR